MSSLLHKPNGWFVLQRAHACCVVARQYSAVLRMLQIRQSSSTVNLAASETSFSFRRLLMVSPPVLLLDLKITKKERKKVDKKRIKLS